MKILLFNLGPIQHRIIAWGIDGFKSFFEQDTILWGPIPDSNFFYQDKEIPILRISGVTTIKNVFDQLPENWHPDIVICDTSVLNYVPDIYLCPVKTILFTRDSWSDTIFNRSLVELFDFLKYSVIDRAAYKNLHINILPLSGFAVSIPPDGTVNSTYKSRSIDVIAIASYNDSFYHERYRTFYRLADSNRNGLNIKFFRGIKRSEIYSYYQRSKIVIDWAHTLSNRSFEAALNGCLLFSYEDNKLIEDFWIPWEEYIPYKEENLMELVTYYVNNPEQAEKIINRAHSKILSNPANWGQMAWKNIQMALDTNINVQERIDHVESLPVTEVIHRSATALLYNYEYNTRFPADWQDIYFERIDRALSAADNKNVKIKPLVEGARMAVLLKRNTHYDKYLNDLKEILPEYAWTYFFQGRINYEKGDYENALVLLQKAIECGLDSPELLKKYFMPVIERGNSCDGRRITNYMWQPVYKQNNEYQVEAFLHLAFDLKGQAYQKIGDQEKAIDAYSDAIHNSAVPSCLYRVSPLLVDSGKFEKLSDLAGKEIKNSPYDTILILYKALALVNIKKKSLALKTLSDHRNALKSFLGVRKTTYIKSALILIMTSVLFGRRMSSKVITVFISILKKKSVNITE